MSLLSLMAIELALLILALIALNYNHNEAAIICMLGVIYCEIAKGKPQGGTQ